jgi:hypothetical protein
MTVPASSAPCERVRRPYLPLTSGIMLCDAHDMADPAYLA